MSRRGIQNFYRQRPEKKLGNTDYIPIFIAIMSPATMLAFDETSVATLASRGSQNTHTLLRNRKTKTLRGKITLLTSHALK